MARVRRKVASRVATIDRYTEVVDNQPTTTPADSPGRARVSLMPLGSGVQALMPTATVLFLLTFGILSVTSAQEPEVAAEQAALSWLSLLDGEQYFESWNDAATLFKDQLPPVQWEHSASAARARFGALHSRRLKSAAFATSLPGAPDGEYVVLEFDSVFEHKAAAVEMVTPMLENGVWLVSGYYHPLRTVAFLSAPSRRSHVEPSRPSWGTPHSRISYRCRLLACWSGVWHHLSSPPVLAVDTEVGVPLGRRLLG